MGLNEINFIDENKKKCRIGEGCLYAIVSNSGLLIQKINVEDDYGTDFEIKQLVKVGNDYHYINTYFKIQLKSTTNWNVVNNEVVYDLEKKAFDNIILHNNSGTVKSIVVLMCLEKETNNWCYLNHEYIKFQNSLFWFYTDSLEYSSNTTAQRIKIPMSQVFNEESIFGLIDKFKVEII